MSGLGSRVTVESALSSRSGVARGVESFGRALSCPNHAIPPIQPRNTAPITSINGAIAPVAGGRINQPPVLPVMAPPRVNVRMPMVRHRAGPSPVPSGQRPTVNLQGQIGLRLVPNAPPQRG